MTDELNLCLGPMLAIHKLFFFWGGGWVKSSTQKSTDVSMTINAICMVYNISLVLNTTSNAHSMKIIR